MPRFRTSTQKAAGRLISAIQREWLASEVGHQADIAEHVMNAAHGLLQATSLGLLEQELDGRSVADYLGAIWVKRHPAITSAILALENAHFEERQHA